MSHPEFYNPASMTLGAAWPPLILRMAGGQVVSEASSRLEIGPSDAPKSLHGATLSQSLFHNYPIPEPKRPYVKFGMTHDIITRDDALS
jgi:hypothetical protein